LISVEITEQKEKSEIEQNKIDEANNKGLRIAISDKNDKNIKEKMTEYPFLPLT